MANMMSPVKGMKKGKETTDLRKKLGMLDDEGKLIPRNQARAKLFREAQIRELDDMEGGKFVEETMEKLGYYAGAKGRAAGGTVEKPLY